MLKRFVLIAACAVLLGASIATAQQQPPPPPKPEAPAAPAPAPAPAPPQAPSTPPPPRALGQPVTIRVDVTVTDQVATAAPTRKTATLLAADRERASVRSITRSPGLSSQFNIDARPILDQDRIRLDLSVVYDPPPITLPGADKPIEWTTTVQQSMGVVVENGKAVVVSQSADPRTDRKVTVEVKATIQK